MENGMIQIVFMNDKDYILEYEDFDNRDYEGMLTYLKRGFVLRGVIKIHCKKWETKENDTSS